MKNKITLLLPLLLISIHSIAQLQVEWSQIASEYDGGLNTPKLKIIPQEEILVVGQDIIIKYDKHGNELWHQKLPGQAYYHINAGRNHHFVIDSIGNIYVTFNQVNYTNGIGIDSTDASVYTRKYSPDGLEIWTTEFRTSSGMTYDTGANIVIHNDKLYVSGHSISPTQAFLVCYSTETGSEQWRKTPSEDNHDCYFGVGLAVDASGFVYLGSTENQEAYCLMKYDSDGNLLWKSAYGNNDFSNHYLNQITISTNNKIVASGLHYITASFDDDGNLIWSATPPSNSGINTLSDLVEDILVLDDGSIILTGKHIGDYNSVLDFEDDAFTMKIDNNGNMLWTARHKLNDDEHQIGFSISQDLDGNILVGGVDKIDDNTGFLINKYDNTTGELIWTYFDDNNGSFWSQINSIEVSLTGEIYVTGLLYNKNKVQILTKKYQEIQVSTQSINNTSTNFKIVPNPVSKGEFKIITQNNSLTTCQIKVFNLIGQEILTNNTYEFETAISLNNLSDGTYFVVINFDGKSTIKKIIVE